MTTKINKVTLAPMEGVADVLMRDLLTSINHYDLCVTEFVRIVDKLVPTHVFHRISPELQVGGFTSNKTPTRVQLLGQEPNWMAENAVRAISLGSHGIDINFGCPAKAVNKSKGGAILLKTPEIIYQIVKSVKDALPEKETVSAKIRLGFDDASLLDEIVSAITSANADQLTIHARTKRDGYNPPAYWHHIGEISDKYNIELFANGEIWSLADAKSCIKAAKTPNIMIGRGALATPNLANVVKETEEKMSWKVVCLLFKRYAELELQGDKSYYFSSRLKQWLRYLKLQYPQADNLFNAIKLIKCKEDIIQEIEKFNIYIEE